ncbi:nitroreductase family protein [Beijerinckia indica]|uniref:Nitroreductase n=1 Tax=Beijerinckia indica subsp. indica (strain ATCC 9039 / DSM 1715 / NCIMB 8712) TaxID=395963 RepID=B2IBB9_BEII9|nr:nitroreductase family protein [Beijerinckia indica]ACB95203.1 nitroreductase [Beijerinckia indica subsp. indica ATCC 9039]
MTQANLRKADHPVETVFLERWSPRAFSPEPIPETDLHTIFEAARWAPSAYNSQPWRFLFARHGTPEFATLLGLLIEFNQSWAKNAAVLSLLISKKTFVPPGKTEPVLSHSHSVDAGAAWGFLALQATKLGYAVHAMTGFDIPRAALELNIPDDYRVELAFALGRRADKSILPEGLQAREVPSSRNPLSTYVFEGQFKPD